MYNSNDGNWDPNLSEDIYGMKNTPDFFNIDKLRTLEDFQIGRWDETHTKVIIVFFNLNKITLVFHLYRGSGGNVIGSRDESNGTFNEEPFINTMKFPG